MSIGSPPTTAGSAEEAKNSHIDNVHIDFNIDPATLLTFGTSTYLVEFVSRFNSDFVSAILERNGSVLALPDMPSFTSQHISPGLIAPLGVEEHGKLLSTLQSSHHSTLTASDAETFVASLDEQDRVHVLDAIWEIATRAGKVTLNVVKGNAASSKLRATSEVAMAAIAARMGVGIPLISGRLSSDNTRSELITLWNDTKASNLPSVYSKETDTGKRVAMVAGIRHVVNILGGLGISHLDVWNSALVDLDDPMLRVYVGKFDASKAFPEDGSVLSAMISLLAVLISMHDANEAHKFETIPLWLDLYGMAQRVSQHPKNHNLITKLEYEWQKRNGEYLAPSPRTALPLRPVPDVPPKQNPSTPSPPATVPPPFPGATPPAPPPGAVPPPFPGAVPPPPPGAAPPPFPGAPGLKPDPVYITISEWNETVSSWVGSRNIYGRTDWKPEKEKDLPFLEYGKLNSTGGAQNDSTTEQAMAVTEEELISAEIKRIKRSTKVELDKIIKDKEYSIAAHEAEYDSTELAIRNVEKAQEDERQRLLEIVDQVEYTIQVVTSGFPETYEREIDNLKTDLKNVKKEIIQQQEYLSVARDALENPFEKSPPPKVSELSKQREKTANAQYMYLEQYKYMLINRLEQKKAAALVSSLKQQMQKKINELKIDNMEEYLTAATGPSANPTVKTSVADLKAKVKKVTDAQEKEKRAYTTHNKDVEKVQKYRKTFAVAIDSLLAEYEAPASTLKPDSYDDDIEYLKKAREKYSNKDPNIALLPPRDQPSESIEAVMVGPHALHKLVMHSLDLGAVFRTDANTNTQNDAYATLVVDFLLEKKHYFVNELNVKMSEHGTAIAFVSSVALAGLARAKANTK
tara:strand:+ start:418 stop:2997 length:2580 start_codon:yes stop_codon:yes gene_type:complete